MHFGGSGGGILGVLVMVVAIPILFLFKGIRKVYRFIFK